MAQTIAELFERFPDDACLAQVFESRDGHGHACPNCRRSAKWYRIKATRAYACQWRGWHIHPTSGTLFEDTRTPLRLWFYAVYLFTTSRHGVPAKELQRQLGVTYKTAWRMGHEIRRHMAAAESDPPLGGQVEVDETYIGGVNEGAGRGRGLENEAILLGMVQRGAKAITKVIPDASRQRLLREIGRNLRRGGAVHTDEFAGCGGLEGRGCKHRTVNHSRDEYASADGRGTQHVEGYFSRLKSSIRGTHVSASPKHLPKHAGEFECRHNRRKRPTKVLDELLSAFPPPDEG
jgi:transposase